MTDSQRPRLRNGLEALMRVMSGSGTPGLAINFSDPYHVTVAVYDPVKLGNSPLPELTNRQQLALSVLLGEDVPLSVLLNACEDDGVFPNGVLEAVAEKARAEERERCATLIETARYTISPGVIGQEQIVALAQKIAAGLRSQ